jgi:hypothetical protein
MKSQLLSKEKKKLRTGKAGRRFKSCVAQLNSASRLQTGKVSGLNPPVIHDGTRRLLPKNSIFSLDITTFYCDFYRWEAYLASVNQNIGIIQDVWCHYFVQVC